MALAAVPATLEAAADVSALFKTDVAAEGIGYGEGTRSLFVTALARQYPDRLAGLGAGYLGELDGLRLADTMRRMTAPVDMDLHGEAAGTAFLDDRTR